MHLHGAFLVGGAEVFSSVGAGEGGRRRGLQILDARSTVSRRLFILYVERTVYHFLEAMTRGLAAETDERYVSTSRTSRWVYFFFFSGWHDLHKGVPHRQHPKPKSPKPKNPKPKPKTQNPKPKKPKNRENRENPEKPINKKTKKTGQVQRYELGSSGQFLFPGQCQVVLVSFSFPKQMQCTLIGRLPSPPSLPSQIITLNLSKLSRKIKNRPGRSDAPRGHSRCNY